MSRTAGSEYSSGAAGDFVVVWMPDLAVRESRVASRHPQPARPEQAPDFGDVRRQTMARRHLESRLAMEEALRSSLEMFLT